MASDEAWIERITSVKTWSRGGERAPHKPLLLLVAFAQLQRTGSSSVRFVDVESTFAQAWAVIGSPRKVRAEYPFHHLASDGFWTVDTRDGSPSVAQASRLRKVDAVGHLDPELDAALLTHPDLLALAAHALLDQNWPETLHEDVALIVGLDLRAAEEAAVVDRVRDLAITRRRRDRAFRQSVLIAYEYRCAFCEFDGRLGPEAVGLDAAHVRWFAFDGPDAVDNGLCLCAFHHKLFDLGVLGISDSHTVRVSKLFVGRGATATSQVLSLQGRPMVEPQAGEPAVEPAHIAWHADQVFRGPERVGAPSLQNGV